MMRAMSSSAGLAAQVAKLVGREEQVRRRDPEGVHRARVATRRLRAVLAAYRPVLDREVSDPLREELRWFGNELSGSRDRHVVHQLLTRMLAEEPRGLVAEQVVRRVEREYGGSGPVTGAIDSHRYAALRAALTGLPDVHPDEPVLRRQVCRDVARVVARHDGLAPAVDPDAAMHDVRKAAKRLRYSAEAWQPVGGKNARRTVRAARRLTSHLGERQDTVLVRVHLLGLADEAAAAGEPTFTYGRLHAREQRRAEDLDAALPEVWRRFLGGVTWPGTRSTC